MAADPTADEFDCVDCGRHIIAFPAAVAARTGQRCATCHALPGWFYLDELRERLDPEFEMPLRQAQGDSAQRPQTPEDPGLWWRCEFPGCQSQTLVRVTAYGQPFRGRCPDHLAPWIARELHGQRNRIRH